MSRYRKRKSQEVEAMQFTTNNEANGSPTMDKIVNWMNQGQDSVRGWHNSTDIFIVIQSVGTASAMKDETVRVRVGDWIVREPGGFLPYEHREFTETYEAMS